MVKVELEEGGPRVGEVEEPKLAARTRGLRSWASSVLSEGVARASGKWASIFGIDEGHFLICVIIFWGLRKSWPFLEFRVQGFLGD